MDKAVNDPRLTQREREVLEALLTWRDRYGASGNALAAKIMGVAIWLAWQVLARTNNRDHEGGTLF